MRMTRGMWISMILPAIIFISACSPRQTEEPPGVGAKAGRGYAACNPIIMALEQYLEANGSYPPALRELVPDHLSAVPSEVNGEPILYARTDDGYDLSFAYVGPGMNICTYSPGRGWRCSGAY